MLDCAHGDEKEAREETSEIQEACGRETLSVREKTIRKKATSKEAAHKEETGIEEGRKQAVDKEAREEAIAGEENRSGQDGNPEEVACENQPREGW
jgi:hypothetical protein